MSTSRITSSVVVHSCQCVTRHGTARHDTTQHGTARQGMAELILHGPRVDPPPPSVSLGMCYLTRLAAHGDNTAIVQAEDGVSVTYRDVLRDGQLACALLKARGLREGDTCMVACANTRHYAPLMLGALFAGAAVAPVNPSFHKDDLLYLLATIRPQMVVSNKCAEPRIKEALALHPLQVALVTMEAVLECWRADTTPPHEFQLALVADIRTHVALVMCSSGSTGKPKGVELTHFNLLSMLQTQFFPAETSGSEIVTLNMSGPFWITCQLLTMFSLCWGKKLVLLERFEPEAFFRTVEQFKVSVCLLNPEMLGAIARRPGTDGRDVSSLHTVLYGGAAVGAATVACVGEKLGGCAMSNWYGLTECEGQLRPFWGANDKPGSAGTLGYNTAAKVVDVATGQLLGPNCPGELCFLSPGVFKGYRGNPEATRATFDEAGFLRSGDIGSYDEDGHFYVTDRIKEMFKYNGIHISGVDIEEVLLRHPAVLEAAVVGIPHEVDCARATGFIVLRHGASATQQELLQLVQDTLPCYKWLHGGIRLVESLPRTSSGKMLRQELRKQPAESVL